MTVSSLLVTGEVGPVGDGEGVVLLGVATLAVVVVSAVDGDDAHVVAASVVVARRQLLDGGDRGQQHGHGAQGQSLQRHQSQTSEGHRAHHPHHHARHGVAQTSAAALVLARLDHFVAVA